MTLAYKAYSAVESASATVDDFKTVASDTASSSEKALSAVSLVSNLLSVGTVQRKINGVFKSVNQKKANKKRNNRSNNKAEKPGSSGSDSATEKSGGNKEKSTSDGGEPPGGRGNGSGGGDSSDGAKRTVSKIDDITKPGSKLPNIKTDVPKAEFETNLINNGFAKSTSKDGSVNIFSNGNKKFTTRDFSKSTDGPTAEVFKNNRPISKIRLGDE